MGNESPRIGLVACCWMLQLARQWISLAGRMFANYLSPILFVPSANIEGCLAVTYHLYYFFFFCQLLTLVLDL